MAQADPKQDYKIVRGIDCIRVRGNTAERALAHAQLLKQRIPTGPLPFLVKKNEWLIRRGPGLLQMPLVQSIAVSFYKKILVPLMNRRLHLEVREAISAMALELGLTYTEMLECVIQADGLMLLARTSMMKHLLPEGMVGGVPGCTSAVAFPAWTRAGKLLACRNLDYFIVGPWEREATVVFNEPSDRGEIPYVALTSAGVQTGGLTAMNREGLTLFTHAHFGKKVTLRGNPVVVVGDELIRKAKTLSQAIDLVNQRRPFANWSFVISSAKEKDAVVIQMTPDRIRVHRVEDGLLTHTNYFHSEELRKTEALLSGAYCEDLQARMCRIRQLLEPHRGMLEPQNMATALGDHQDYLTGQERVFGNTLSVVTTIKSAVFEPDSQRFWMGTRAESPVGLGEYLQIDVDQFWAHTQDELESSAQMLAGYQPKAPGLVEAVRSYREAYRSFHMDNQSDDFRERSLVHIQRAAEQFPQDGHVWVQAALLAFRLQHFDQARRNLEKTLSLSLSPHVLLVRNLYLARCLDLLGERQAAVTLYQQSYVKAAEPKLKRAFRQGIRRSFRRGQVAEMVIDLQFPDTFAY